MVVIKQNADFTSKNDDFLGYFDPIHIDMYLIAINLFEHKGFTRRSYQILMVNTRMQHCGNRLPGCPTTGEKKFGTIGNQGSISFKLGHFFDGYTRKTIPRI